MLLLAAGVVTFALAALPLVVLGFFIWPFADDYVLAAPTTWSATLPAAVAGLAGGAILGLVLRRDLRGRVNLWSWSVMMLAAAIGSTLPLSAVPDFALDDMGTSFFPAAFLLPAGAGLAFLGVNAVSGFIGRLRPAGAMLAATVLVAYIAVAVQQVALAYEIQPERVARWSL